ncbi:MAG: DUF6529 family protein, partial [Candidatus Dormibacteria bacterium]
MAVSDVTGRPSSTARALVPLLFGAGIAVSLGAYGRLHDPTGQSLFSLVFTRTITMKAWLATLAAGLAVFQLLSALRMYGRISIPRTMPPWLPTLHRVSGAIAFVLAVPVAYHCLLALGFQTLDARHLVHSVAGCVFFGAVGTKVLVVPDRTLPGWMLPLAGGVLFSALIAVWLTSS